MITETGRTLRPLISLAALHIRGKFPCMIMKAAIVQLIWLLVVCRFCSIREFAAVRRYQIRSVIRQGHATYGSECYPSVKTALWPLRQYIKLRPTHWSLYWPVRALCFTRTFLAWLHCRGSSWTGTCSISIAFIVRGRVLGSDADGAFPMVGLAMNGATDRLERRRCGSCEASQLRWTASYIPRTQKT